MQPTEPQQDYPRAAWLFPLLLLVVLLAVALGRAWFDESPSPRRAPAGEPDGLVTVTLEPGDAPPFTVQSPVRPSVLDVLREVGREHPAYRPQVSGEGEWALVTAIGEWENQAGGRNWTYQVNGTPADRSAGVMGVAAGDRVLWRFARDE